MQYMAHCIFSSGDLPLMFDSEEKQTNSEFKKKYSTVTVVYPRLPYQMTNKILFIILLFGCFSNVTNLLKVLKNYKNLY